MNRKFLPIAFLSALFALSSLTSCNEEEFANLKNDFQTQIDEIKEEISDIKTQITTLRTEMNESIESVREDYQTKIDALNSELDDLEEELKALEKKHDEDKAALEADYNSKLTTLSTSFTTSVNELNESITANQTAITNLTNKHDQDVQAVTTAYLEKIEELKKIDADARAELYESLSNSISALDAEFEEALNALSSSVTNNATAISNLTNKLTQDIKDVTSAYEAAIAELGEDEQEARELLKTKLEQDIATLNSNFETELANLQSEVNANADAITALTNKHNQDIATVTGNYETAIANLSSSEQTARANLKAELEQEISNLDTTFEEQVATLQTSITANQTAITNLTNQFNSDKTTLQEDYNAKITALDNEYTTKVNEINTAINNLQTALNNAISEMNTQITNIQNDYNSKINDLTSRVGALEEVQTHTVSYYIYCNSEFELLTTEEVNHGEKAHKPELPSASGYEYADYWLAIDGYQGVTEQWWFLNAVVTEDINLYMIKSPLSYTITLDENYSGAPSPYEKSGLVYSGQTFTCPVPSRAHYSFNGWYYGDTQVTDSLGNSLSTYEFADNVILTAQWGAIRDGLTPETAYNTEEAIALMDYYGDSQIVGGNVEYYVMGVVQTGSTINTTYHQWYCYLDEPDSDGKQFKISGATLSDGSSISEVDGAIDGYTVVVKGYMELYQGEYKIGYLPASVSPTGNKFVPVILL